MGRKTGRAENFGPIPTPKINGKITSGTLPSPSVWYPKSCTFKVSRTKLQSRNKHLQQIFSGFTMTVDWKIQNINFSFNISSGQFQSEVESSRAQELNTICKWVSLVLLIFKQICVSRTILIQTKNISSAEGSQISNPSWFKIAVSHLGFWTQEIKSRRKT